MMTLLMLITLIIILTDISTPILSTTLQCQAHHLALQVGLYTVKETNNIGEKI